MNELPHGSHSFEKIFIVEKITGYKTVYYNINIDKIMEYDRKKIEEKCAKLGIQAVLKDDFITLHSFPKRNVIKNDILNIIFSNGVKTLEIKSYFDILEYFEIQ